MPSMLRLVHPSERTSRSPPDRCRGAARVHEALRRQGLASPHHSTLMALGVMCCPKACVAYFDGGANNISRHLAAHVAANKCLSRLKSRHSRTRELEGPSLSSTMAGIHDALRDIAMQARAITIHVVPHAHVFTFCLRNPSFTMEHLRTSGAQSAASISGLSKLKSKLKLKLITTPFLSGLC